MRQGIFTRLHDVVRDQIFVTGLEEERPASDKELAAPEAESRAEELAELH